MIDADQMQILIYNHAVQLTLLDYGVTEAFEVAHRTAALGFDDKFTQAGLAHAARSAMGDPPTVQGTPGKPVMKSGKGG